MVPERKDAAMQAVFSVITAQLVFAVVFICLSLFVCCTTKSLETNDLRPYDWITYSNITKRFREFKSFSSHKGQE